jgi:hypothetical protein
MTNLRWLAGILLAIVILGGAGVWLLVGRTASSGSDGSGIPEPGAPGSAGPAVTIGSRAAAAPAGCESVDAPPRSLPSSFSSTASDIPGTLQALDAALGPAHKAYLRCFADEDELRERLQSGFGRWLRNRLHLRTDTPLTRTLQDLGVRTPDEASALILVLYHRQLRGEPLAIDTAVVRTKARRGAGSIIAPTPSSLLLARASGCPKADVNAVLHDPRVRQSLDRAWRGSREGTAQAQEQGGSIYQCRHADSHGGFSYNTDVRPWSNVDVDATGAGLDDASASQSDACRLVASYHTHPAGLPNTNPWDGFNNSEPSDDDFRASGNDGVPGIIRYGTGDNTTDVIYGYNGMTEPRDPGWTCGTEIDRPGDSFGDTHLSTFDGYRYDFQAIGDFVLAATDGGDVEVQTRQTPFRDRTFASVNSGVAIRDGADRIEWTFEQQNPLIDGARRAVLVDQQVTLRSHGVLRNTEDGFLFISSVGDRVWVYRGLAHLDARVQLAPHRLGKARGLLGDFDGRPDNDLVTAAGEKVALGNDERRLFSHGLYARFGASWRVATDRGLFARPFSSVSTIDPATFPQAAPALTDAERLSAEQACRTRGVANPVMLEACVFDVAVTREPAFVEGALRVDRDIDIDTASSSAAAGVASSAAAATAASVGTAGTSGAAAAGGTAAPRVVVPDVIRADQEIAGSFTRERERRSAAYAIDLDRGAYVFDARGSRGSSWSLRGADHADLFDANQGSFMGEYPAKIAIPQAGRYTIDVTLQPTAAAGTFRFRVHPAPIVVSKTIALDTPIEDRITKLGEEHPYRLRLTAGSYDFRPLASDNTSWALLAPDGSALFDANQQTFMQEAAGVRIPTDGTYTLIVKGRNIVGLGPYRFTVTRHTSASRED